MKWGDGVGISCRHFRAVPLRLPGLALWVFLMKSQTSVSSSVGTENTVRLNYPECISDAVRIGSMIISHLSNLWKANFFILCDVRLLVRLQIDHSWEMKAGLMPLEPIQYSSGPANSPADWPRPGASCFWPPGGDYSAPTPLASCPTSCSCPCSPSPVFRGPQPARKDFAP